MNTDNINDDAVKCTCASSVKDGGAVPENEEIAKEEEDMKTDERDSEATADTISAEELKAQNAQELNAKCDASATEPNDESEVATDEQGDLSEKPADPDWKDQFTRLLAEFDNFRKRTERDREDLVKSAARGIIKDVLVTVDNLARALDGAKDKSDDPFVQGVKLVYDGLLKTLESNGATPIDSLGEPFDVNYHEALAQMPSADVEEGIVMNEVTRGWLLHGKLLRAAKVVVSAGKGE